MRIFAALLFVLLGAAGASAQDAQARREFTSAEEAVAALVAALEKDDVAGLAALLGPGGEGILSSGDPVADSRARKGFLERYRAKHSLVADGADSMTLVVGDNEWPLPVPIVNDGGKWFLDGAAGADEIVYRRIGRNELGAIAVCRGFVDAQFEYASRGHDGNEPGVFASKLLSDPGLQNGLYWATAEGEPESPAGPAVAAAAEEGYRMLVGGARTPYHGYYYRMLFAQGAHANGGASEYFVDGLLTQGVALLAWPADYGVSGVKSFLINHEGVVYEKDLGVETSALAEDIEVFDPDSSWAKVGDEGDS